MNNLFQTRNFISSVIIGSLGGIALILLSYDPFQLFYLGGYLILAVLILVIVFSIKLIKPSQGEKTRYLERALFGFIACLCAIVWSQVYLHTVDIHKPGGNNLFFAILMQMGLGIILTLLLSVKFKRP